MKYNVGVKILHWPRTNTVIDIFWSRQHFFHIQHIQCILYCSCAGSTFSIYNIYNVYYIV